MSQPRAVSVSNGIPRGYHDTILHLVELTATLMEAPLYDCEVHVKAGKQKYAQTTGYAYYTSDGKPWSDQVWQSRIKVAPGVRYLITLKLNEGFDKRYEVCGPRTLHYWRYKTAPYTEVYSWEEEFVYICAHEMHHIQQFDRPRKANGRPFCSEIECEHNAIGALALYRIVVGPRATTAHAARK